MSDDRPFIGTDGMRTMAAEANAQGVIPPAGSDAPMQTGRMTNLEYLRRRIGFTQQQLGEAAGLQRARISLMERGRVIPPRHSRELMHLAGALGVPVVEAGSLLDEVGDDGH